MLSHAIPQKCIPTLLWCEKIVFSNGIITRGSVHISSNGIISHLHPDQTEQDASKMASHLSLDFRSFGHDAVISPGFIDVHTHISELGRNWEGYRTATRSSASGGITTIMGMPLNSIPSTSSIEAFEMEVKAARSTDLLADVGLWGGAIPSNASSPTALKSLLNCGVFGLKAFLAPLPPSAGFEALSVEELSQVATLCGEAGLPLLVHSELMTMDDVNASVNDTFGNDGNERSYQAHLKSRPAKWEADAIEQVCKLTDRCDMHIVHLSDARLSLDIIAKTKKNILLKKQQSMQDGVVSSEKCLTVETCPHYLLFDDDCIEDGDTRYKCFPPIRDSENREILLSHLTENCDIELDQSRESLRLIDMVASDHSPCSPEMRCMYTGDFKMSWGGLSGLQYQMASTFTALHNHGIMQQSSSIRENMEDCDLSKHEAILQSSINAMFTLWSKHPSKLIPGLNSMKGSIDIGKRADLVVWDPSYQGKPNSYSKEHHRWKGTSVYSDQVLRGRVISTWLGGIQVYDGEKDCFPSDQNNGSTVAPGRLLIHKASP